MGKYLGMDLEITSSTKESVEDHIGDCCKYRGVLRRRINTQCAQSAVPGSGKAIQGLKVSSLSHC